MAETPDEELSIPPAIQNRVIGRLILKILLLLLAIAAGLWILFRLETVIFLLILSLLFSYLIAPLVEWFERPVRIGGRPRKLPHSAAIAVVYLIMTAFIGLVAYALLPALAAQVSLFVDSLPDYTVTVRRYFVKLQLFYRHYKIPPEWQKTISSEITQVGESLFQWLYIGLLRVLGVARFLPWLILVPILSFFMLKDGEVFRGAIISAFPTKHLQHRVNELINDMSQTLAAYIRAQLLACLIVGSLSTLGFVLLGSPYPLVLGVIAGTLEFIPLAGPLVAAIIAASVSATVSAKIALYVLAFLAALRIVQDYIIYPRLIGHGLEMHPLAIIIAVLSGAELNGVIGIFLAIPFVAIVTVAYRHWQEHRGSHGIVAELLQPAVPLTKPTKGASDLKSVPSEILPKK